MQIDFAMQILETKVAKGFYFKSIKTHIWATLTGKTGTYGKRSAMQQHSHGIKTRIRSQLIMSDKKAFSQSNLTANRMTDTCKLDIVTLHAQTHAISGIKKLICDNLAVMFVCFFFCLFACFFFIILLLYVGCL